ncbi:facilitated trehalose transporter Tret1 [Cephus cinctus]|uniref:Facilitated trehalose transporter Tret1 n=1 Tax=Cephus cinctus TaxID=211228 RepID=A0AAJ7CB74_CEPCN|nr:facilitated trehalose transporter Tret1 [Cephus cinctus]
METKKKTPAEPGQMQQIVATAIVNLSALIYGTIVGWASPMTPKLQSPDPPVGLTPMSDEVVSWLTGVLCIGALMGTPVFGAISEKFGRKIAGCLLTIPYGICWITTIFAQDQTYLLVARFFAGVGASGSILLVPLYVGEIASSGRRGMLGSLLVLFINVGILIGFVAGAILSFKVFAICALVLPLCYLGAFVFLPESPVYLVRCNRTKDAARALLWLRGGDKPTVDRELLSLQAQVKEAAALNGKVSFKDLFANKGTFKGLIIVLGLLGGQQLCGIFAMVNYAATIFQMAGSSMSPNTASIIVGAIQVFGSYLSTSLMERAGRKLLILISCIGMCICHCTLGTFCYLQALKYEVSSFSWIPVTALSVYVVVYCLGMGPAPFVVASEVFSAEMSSLANSVSLIFLWALGFFVVKLFGTFMGLFGIHGCFFILAAFCSCTFVFTLILVPETKGRTIQSILDELNGFPVNSHNGDYRTTNIEVKKDFPIPEQV